MMLNELIHVNFTLLVMVAIFVILIGGTVWAYWKVFNDPT